MTGNASGRALVTAVLAHAAAAGALAGQTVARRSLEVSPPRATLGQTLTVLVRGAAAGADYRFVATRTATGSADRIAARDCGGSSELGSGTRTRWTPASGSYRLAAYGPSRRRETDTLLSSYVVSPRPVMLATARTPAQPSGVTLTLRTDDLGPGHVHFWWMQYVYPTGSGPGNQTLARSQPWTTQTNGPMATYPEPIPSSAAVSARVTIHRGNPCDVLATGATSPNQ